MVPMSDDGDGSRNADDTVASPLSQAGESTARFDSAPTGPKQPAFTPAWSEEPPPNPYLAPDPYDEPYPDPDPAHSPTMTAMPAMPAPGPPREWEPEHHHSGPTVQTWAMAAVAAVLVLVVVLVVVMTRAGSDTAAQPPPGPPPTTSAPAPPPTTAAPTTTIDGRAAPPPVAGNDGVGETCLDGYQITGQAGWASHGVRGNTAATCAFVENVLRSYWNAADPSDAPRTIVTAGAIPCGDGAQCSGEQFVVTCAVEAPDPWVTCRGGRDAVVYLY